MFNANGVETVESKPKKTRQGTGKHTKKYKRYSWKYL